MTASRTRWPQALGMAVVLGLVAFAIFGPLANLLLWAFAEKWYFPNRIPQEFGLTFWARVFSSRGNALASLGTSVWIAMLTVFLSLAVAIPAGFALARWGRALWLRLGLAALLAWSFVATWGLTLAEQAFRSHGSIYPRTWRPSKAPRAIRGVADYRRCRAWSASHTMSRGSIRSSPPDRPRMGTTATTASRWLIARR